MSDTALVVVDVQKDFVEGGSLAVEGGLQVAHDIEKYIMGNGRYADHVIATKDWHNHDGDNGHHFSDDPDFAHTWPAHCVASSTGAEFANGLNARHFDAVFHKGWDAPAYSGFQAHLNGHPATNLDSWLIHHDVNTLVVCGIATDYCVYATVIDALDKGYNVVVSSSLTVAVADKEQALDLMRAHGAIII